MRAPDGSLLLTAVSFIPCSAKGHAGRHFCECSASTRLSLSGDGLQRCSLLKRSRVKCKHFTIDMDFDCAGCSSYNIEAAIKLYTSGLML